MNQEPSREFRFRFQPAGRRADVLALGMLVLGIVLVAGHRFYYDNWLARHDLLAFFLSWYGYLGEHLANGDIPGWNAYQFAGSPLLGDPESGWMYLPVMVTFPFLSIAVAMKALILIQLLIGGTATYSLGRVLGFGALGALMSSVSFVFGPYLISQTQCCTVASELSGWLPVAFLGVELGLRTRHWIPRLAAWSLSGFAVSQMFATWLGQGLALALLMVAAWIGWRGLVDPPREMPWRERIIQTFLGGAATIGLGVAGSAAGLLPRLAVNEEATIRSGDYTGVFGGADQSPSPWSTVIGTLLRDDRDNRATALGGVLVILIMLGVIFARRRHAVPFFAGITAIAVILAAPVTPIHRILFLIPEFETLHMHSPSRVLWLIGFPPAMLAGAAIHTMLRQHQAWQKVLWCLVPVIVLHVTGLWLGSEDVAVDRSVYIAAWVATLLAMTVVVSWGDLLPDFRQAIPRLGAVALIVLVFFWPLVPELIGISRNPEDTGTSQISGRSPEIQKAIAETLSSSDPGGAGEFLQNLQEDGEVFRYATWAGMGTEEGPNDSTPSRRMEPVMLALLTNTRPLLLGLQNISGYNPLQLKVYSEYLTAANGEQQDYHHADLYPGGFDSPLIDMLNVQYFLLDATLDPARPEVQALLAQGEEIYRDDLVVIIRNDSAMPRGWIVHEVRPASDTTLEELASGSVDGRQVAFVEDFTPEMFPLAPADGAAESVEFTSYSEDAMSMQVTAATDGYLVLSEIASEGWTATIDGKEVDIHTTNHSLRGLPVPAGTHTVELTFTPPGLTAGLWISGFTGAGMVAIWVVFLFGWWRGRREWQSHVDESS